MYLKTLFAYTDHRERKADGQVKEIAHIKVPICWEAEGQLKKLPLAVAVSVVCDGATITDN